MDFLDWLGVFFEFRDDNVQNQGERLVFHLAKLPNVSFFVAEDRWLPWPDHALELLQQAPQELHLTVLVSWSKISGDRVSMASIEELGCAGGIVDCFYHMGCSSFSPICAWCWAPIHLAVVLEYLATEVLKLLENSCLWAWSTRGNVFIFSATRMLRPMNIT